MLHRGYDVYVGHDNGDEEVDFVAKLENETIYIQVAVTTLDETVLNRELAPLKKIRDNHPKFILTLDELFGNISYDGIQKRNLIDWLLGVKKQ